MSNEASQSALPWAQRALVASVAVFVTTTIHHVYGAYIYNTPWRLHAALISGLAVVLIAALFHLLKRRQECLVNLIASWTFVALVFAVPFLAFGVFEGAYNHGLKVALYFAHVSPSLMALLYPPPAYEMPNNLFFEITGIAQVIPSAFAGRYLFRFVQQRQRPFRANSNVTTTTA